MISEQMRDCLAEIANFVQQKKMPFLSVIRDGENDQEWLVIDVDRMVRDTHKLSEHERILRQNLLKKLDGSEKVFGFHALSQEEMSDVLFRTILSIS